MDRPPFTEVVAAPEADCLLASTVFLMSRYAAMPCPRLADLVERHLAAVAVHPGCSALLREMSRRAADEWKRHAIVCPLGFAVPPCEE